MELRAIEAGLHIAATQGLTLNVHERLSLDLTLSALKKTEKSASDPFFWGKLLGIDDDYYIAYFADGASSACPQKKFFFSTKSFKFRPLPALTVDEERKFNSLQSVRLTGDPNLVVDAGEAEGGTADPDSEAPNGAEIEKDTEPVNHKLSEIHLLSGLVKRIDYQTAVVPRGAYTIKSGHEVIRSPEFKGLLYSKARELSSWVHFRPAENMETLRRLATDDYQFHADAFESLQSDVPKGSWVFRHDPVTEVVTLRSLMWPGYIAYSVLNTTDFGSVYIGSGEQNLDLPFLLL